VTVTEAVGRSSTSTATTGSSWAMRCTVEAHAVHKLSALVAAIIVGAWGVAQAGVLQAEDIAV
jgi:hypothetical protein